MAEKVVFSVTQLNEYIKDLLERDELLYTVNVRGEISNFTNHRTGHFYFTLKDEGGVLRGVMFKGYASKLPFLPENGMKVILTGRISAYVKDGSYQIYAFTMEPDGVGSLHLAFEQRKKKLEQKGYFAPEHKLPLPKYPKTLGIITSPTGAAIRDMINVATRRFPLCKLVLFPCLVQGEGAPPQLCAGIRYFNEHHPVDVIILGRGGGSLEELWAFNSEELAEEIYLSRIPIVSAVGHETDFSISDFVADLRAPTPSAAAELCVPDREDLKRRLQNVTSKMALLLEGKLTRLGEKLTALKQNRHLMDLQALIDDRRMEILDRERRLEVSVTALMEKKRLLLATTAGKLSALDPLKIMSRGYGAVFDKQGTAIRSVKDLAVGEKLTLRLADGQAKACVEEIKQQED